MTVSLLSTPGLSALDGVVHGFSTRAGGVSPAPWESLNLGRQAGDERANVEVNRRKVLDTLDKSDAKWISLRQVHGDDVVQVSHVAGGMIEADGLWTTDPQAVIAVLVADCVPILMAPRGGGAVAAVHAGWRGTEKKVAARMVSRLKAAGYPPEDLVVAMGPAIGPDCFEIGAEVVEQLRAAFPSAGAAIREGDNGKGRADLWALNRLVLEEAGVGADRIDVVRRCTVTNPELFSHRRDNGRTGRQAGIIALRANPPG